MKTHPLPIATFLLAALLPAAAFGQGPLTPPGAPAPTMKTLDQIEARTPIPGGTAEYDITTPGSYYLTGSFTVGGNAIVITASNVTLDLNGFALNSTNTSGAGDAIFINGSGYSNVTVFNGQIRGTSGSHFAYGIEAATGGTGVRIKDLVITACTNGIYFDHPYDTGNAGLSSTVSNCTINSPGAGITGAGVVQYCLVQNFTNGGIISSNTVTACTVSGSNGSGIIGFNITDCWVSSTYADAIDGYTVKSSYAYSGAGNGIYATGAVENCTAQSQQKNAISGRVVNNCEAMTNTANGRAIYATYAVSNSHGVNGGAEAIDGVYTLGTASNCSGETQGTGYGLYAQVAANNCNGVSNSGTGLYVGQTATGCGGTSASGTGLYSAGTASACCGYSTASTGTTGGLYAERAAHDCYGQSSNGGTGLVSSVAQNCFGYSNTGAGLIFTKVGTACYGYRASPAANNFVNGTGLGGQTSLQ